MQKNIITICKKELKDTVRDRRTLVAMVLMPLLLMPVMTIGMFKFMEKIMEDQKNQTVKIKLKPLIEGCTEDEWDRLKGNALKALCPDYLSVPVANRNIYMCYRVNQFLSLYTLNVNNLIQDLMLHLIFLPNHRKPLFLLRVQVC